MRRRDDPVARRIDTMIERGRYLRSRDWYCYLQAAEALRGSTVVIDGRETLMFASYSYQGVVDGG